MLTHVLPVLYACSGCTSAGELADHLARQLDRAGIVEMASLAGIGAQEPQQLTRARSRFPVIALDGCANACARRCLERNGIEPSRHYVLARYGVARHTGARFAAQEAERALQALRAELE